jgi:peptidoglycan/xylan/chitin deacetylase (PgdA/CDA1 family)
LKLSFFYLSKILGLFWLSRLLFKSKLRILCYHGFSIRDEEKFVPGLFIKPHLFDRRMQYLAEQNYNIITLQEAYELKEKRQFPSDAIVITIDDGFYSVVSKSLPILEKYKFPATLYLTSYYFDKDCPIFNLAVDYMFFKTDLKNQSLEKLVIDGCINQNDPEAAQKIKTFGRTLNSEMDRIRILRLLGELLEVDYDELNQSRILNLINTSELNELIAGNVDIQLHTHRHSLPEESDLADHEIEKNANKINQLLAKPMSHFCYPSGVWSKEHWPVLMKHNIKTATTCEPRLVDYDTHNYSLDRILDSARVSQIEFEAEISGFNELIRIFRGK